jgi:hypothetical protein
VVCYSELNPDYRFTEKGKHGKNMIHKVLQKTKECATGVLLKTPMFQFKLTVA